MEGKGKLSICPKIKRIYLCQIFQCLFFKNYYLAVGGAENNVIANVLKSENYSTENMSFHIFMDKTNESLDQYLTYKSSVAWLYVGEKMLQFYGEFIIFIFLLIYLNRLAENKNGCGLTHFGWRLIYNFDYVNAHGFLG